MLHLMMRLHRPAGLRVGYITIIIINFNRSWQTQHWLLNSHFHMPTVGPLYQATTPTFEIWGLNPWAGSSIFQYEFRDGHHEAGAICEVGMPLALLPSCGFWESCKLHNGVHGILCDPRAHSLLHNLCHVNVNSLTN